ncbi:MAG: hypothetical protein AAFY71_23650 [Bacteroidota bacterium]
MKRKNVPQISNQPWFPSFLRQNIHEFMTWFVDTIGAAIPFLPVIEEGLQHEDRIVVLDAQMGAGFESLQPHIDPQIEISYDRLFDPKIEQNGLYVSVNAFHQLKVEEARQLLQKVMDHHQPIAIVEGNNDSLWQVVGMTIFVPLTVILTAPLVKPFRWSRLLFTYLIPILPLVTFLDGFLALFKLYAPVDLDELTASLSPKDNTTYNWRSGKMDNGRGGKIMYLIGYVGE